MSIRSDNESVAISPVIGVVLFIAIVVTLAGVVGFFATSLSQDQSGTTTSGVQVNQTNSEFSLTVVEEGNSEDLSILVNGREVDSLSSSVGDSLTLSETAQLCEGDEVAVVSEGGDTDTVVSSVTASSDINCQLRNTTTSSSATYDGSSWIVDTYIENTGSEKNSYVVVLSNGSNQQVTETVTLQSGESTTVTSTNSSYSESDPISVGVLSKDQETEAYTLSGGSASGSDSTLSTGTGWSGGDQAGSYYYTPTTSDGTTISSSDSPSSFTSSGSGSEPSLSLSTSRAKTGEDVSVYAALTTTKDPEATETIVVYANETNSSSTLVSKEKVTIQEGETKEVSTSFSLSTANQYVITASLESSDEIYEVGTLNVVNNSSITVSNVSYSPSSPTLDEEITFSADVKNSGSSSNTVTVEFFQNGSEVVSKEVTVGSGSTKTVTGSFTPTQEDLYTFHIGVVEPAIVKKIDEIYISDPSDVSVSVSHSPEEPDAGETVTFNATASHSDSTVSIEEYQWEFDDGVTATTTNSIYERTFENEGEYVQYTVTAVASNGDSQTTGGSVTVPYPAGATPTTFVDNFDDGTYSDNWTVKSGGWSEGGGDINGSGVIIRKSESAYGTWEFKHNHGNQYYGASTWLFGIDTDGDKSTFEKGYYIRHRNTFTGYNRRLVKRTPSGNEYIANLGNYDSGTHTYKVTRKTDGTFIISIDGSKVAEVTDNTYTTAKYVRLDSDDSGHNWYYYSLSE